MSLQFYFDLILLISVTTLIGFTLVAWGRLGQKLMIGNQNLALSSNDAWIGLTIIIALTEVIQIFFPVNYLLSVLYISIAFFQIILCDWTHWLKFFTKLILIARNNFWTLWSGIALIIVTSSAGMLAPGNYDSALYHFTSIAWLNEDAIVFGLGNLHGRLAFNQSSFNIFALLNFYPFWNKGYAIGGVSLFYLTLFSVTQSKVFLLKGGSWLILMCILLTVFFIDDISSPTPDLIVNLLQINIFILLITIFFTTKLKDNSNIVEICTLFCLCVLIFTIKLSSAIFSISTIILIIPIFKKYYLNKIRFFYKFFFFLIFFIMIHLLRGYLLSGAPLYPSSLGLLPNLSWSIPITAIQSELNSTFSWARLPGALPETVIGNWHWLAPWLKALPASGWFNFVITFIFLILIFLMAKKNLLQSKIYLLYFPLLASTFFWFFTAPDLRFLGAIQYLFSILSIWIYLSLIPHPIISLSNQKIKLIGFCIACIFGIQLQIYRPGIFSGWQPLPTISVMESYTNSGLRINIPTQGDQCGTALLPCSPYFNPLLSQDKYGHWKIFTINQ